jgi:HAD superfamily hydrolase (TIGR01484 family)
MSPTAPSLLSHHDVRAVNGIFTDVDDTLTRDGKLTSSTYAALWALHQRGIPVVPVTGRSYGWAHMMLAQWPVDAVIAESGALYLTKNRPLQFFGEQTSMTQARQRLLVRCAELIAANPPLQFASDNHLRQVDVAIDYCENVPRVDDQVVQHLIQTLRAEGFHARCSTVHINAWSGDFDKGPMAMRYLNEAHGIGQAQAQKHWLFIGDAPNDHSMFERFPRSVGVANIVPFLGQMSHSLPARLTLASHGQGFEELAELVLKQNP